MSADKAAGIDWTDKPQVAAYNAAYYRKNKERLDEQNRLWHKENHEAASLRRKKYYSEHKAEAAEYNKAYREANRAIMAAKDKARKDSVAFAAYMKIYYAKNKARIHRINRAYAKAHPEYGRCGVRNRRARLKEAGGRHSVADIMLLLTAQRGQCAYCKKSIRKGHQVDHIMPIALRGTNDRKNLQLTCATCNRSKAAKHPVEFSRQIGLLL